MLERSRICGITPKGLATALACMALGLAGCATMDAERPAPSLAMPIEAKAAPEKPSADPRAILEEASALLAQAETDIQRARSRRACRLSASCRSVSLPEPRRRTRRQASARKRS